MDHDLESRRVEGASEVGRPQAIAICTTTLYKEWITPAERLASSSATSDVIRGDLALESVTAALEKGYRMVIVDGGSSAAFLQALPSSALLHVHPQRERGIGSSRREVFAHVRGIPGVEAICWTEPEKVDYLKRGVQEAAALVLRGEQDLVVVGRKDLSTLPEYQRISEEQCNNIYNLLLRKEHLLHAGDPDWDFFFGPRVMANRDAVWALFDHAYTFKAGEHPAPLDSLIRPEDLSSMLFFPFIEAMKPGSGVHVGNIHVDYAHPESQKIYEEAHRGEFEPKRKKQRADIVGGLYHFLRMLHGDISSKLSRS